MLTFDDKINSPELEAYFAQFPVNGYLSANEINQIKFYVNFIILNNPVLSGFATVDFINNLLLNKVDKIIGKGLSQNDLTNILKAAYDAHLINTTNPHNVTKQQIGLSNVDNTSDNSKPVSLAQAAADLVVLNSSKAYADGLVVGLLDDRGSYNPSVTGAFPTSGGSGKSGAILKGDLWNVAVLELQISATINGLTVTDGDVFRALINSPGQTNANWVITANNFGYMAENSANKSNSAVDIKSTVLFPTWSAVRNWVVSLGYQTVANVNTLLSAFKIANFLDATSSIQDQVNSKLDKFDFRSSNFSAVNDKIYTINGTITITQPTGVPGKGYDFEVISGITTIGALTFGTGSFVKVRFDGIAFQFFHYANDRDLVIVTSTNITTEQSWHGRLVKINNGLNPITVTVNHEITCAGTKSGTANITFVSGAVVSITQMDGILLSAGEAGSTFALTKRESVANGINLYLTNR